MKRQKLIKIIIIIVCLLFILSLIVIFSNFHFHIINNFLIFHSHPSDKPHNDSSPIKSHLHSSLEFLLYFSLFNIDSIALFFMAILTLTISIKYLVSFSNRFIYITPTFLFPVLRAPPLT